MPGMNSGSSPAGPILANAFRSALGHQLVIIALIFLVLLIAWGATRAAILGGPAVGKRGAVTLSFASLAALGGATARGWREPQARRFLRIFFGLLWVFDGLLQAQPQMAGGLADQVIKPTEAGSPSWVVSLMNYGVNLWDYHPITTAASAVWIQVGIGLWMCFAARGLSSRLAAASGIAWGLIVWGFGEAFGGLFAPQLTLLYGAPGGALLYAVAGAFLLLSDRTWERPAAARVLLGLTGVFFLGMALLQAWPSNGFWQGKSGGQPGNLPSMIDSMAATSQPHFLDVLVSGFGNFTQSHGFAVNLVAVIAIAGLGTGLTWSAVRGDVRVARIVVLAATVFCLADWVLIEDLGFFGGLGTDPNSMVPLIGLLVGGCLGLAPAAAAAPAEAPAPTEALPAPEGGVPVVGRPRRLDQAVRGFAATSAWAVAGVASLGVILVGAAPMALASTDPNADPIVAEALAGDSGTLNIPAPGFTLTSQDGKTVSLASLRGKAVLLAFLDPVCTTDCPLIAQEMRSADALLGSSAKNTELVAVVANPTYISTAYTKAFTDQEYLNTVPNWLFLTGSLSQLANVWRNFGIEVEDLPAGAMAAHNDIAFVISPSGVMQQEINDDPGPGTGASLSSFAGLMADSVRQSLGHAQ